MPTKTSKFNWDWTGLQRGERLAVLGYALFGLLAIFRPPANFLWWYSAAGACLLILAWKQSRLSPWLTLIFYGLSFSPIWPPTDWLPFLKTMFIATLLFLSVWKFLKDNFVDPVASCLTLLAALVLPLTWFIKADSGGWAYALLAAVVLGGYGRLTAKRLAWLYLLSAAAIIYQPIVGLPALLLTTALNLKYSHWRIKELLYAAILVLNTITVPILYYYLNSQAAVTPALPTAWSAVSFNLPNDQTLFLNFANLYKDNLGWWLALLSAAGLVIVYRRGQHLSLDLIYLGQSLTAVVAYVLSCLLLLPTAADGLAKVWLMLLLPLMLTALFYLMRTLSRAEPLARLVGLAWLLGFLSAAFYTAHLL